MLNQPDLLNNDYQDQAKRCLDNWKLIDHSPYYWCDVELRSSNITLPQYSSSLYDTVDMWDHATYMPDYSKLRSKNIVTLQPKLSTLSRNTETENISNFISPVNHVPPKKYFGAGNDIHDGKNFVVLHTEPDSLQVEEFTSVNNSVTENAMQRIYSSAHLEHSFREDPNSSTLQTTGMNRSNSLQRSFRNTIDQLSNGNEQTAVLNNEKECNERAIHELEENRKISKGEIDMHRTIAAKSNTYQQDSINDIAAQLHVAGNVQTNSLESINSFQHPNKLKNCIVVIRNISNKQINLSEMYNLNLSDKYHNGKISSFSGSELWDNLNFKNLQTSNIEAKIRKEGKRYKKYTSVLMKRGNWKKKTYKCNICFKRFSLICNLKRHKKSHYLKSYYKCKLCEKTFAHSVLFEMHKRNHRKVKINKQDVSKEIFPCQLEKHGRKYLKNLNSKFLNETHQNVKYSKRDIGARISPQIFLQNCNLKGNKHCECLTRNVYPLCPYSFKTHKMVYLEGSDHKISEKQPAYKLEVSNREKPHKISLTKIKFPDNCNLEMCENICARVKSNNVSGMKFSCQSESQVQNLSCMADISCNNVCKTKVFSNPKLHKEVIDLNRYYQHSICGKILSQTHQLETHKNVHTGSTLFMNDMCSNKISKDCTVLQKFKNTSNTVDVNPCYSSRLEIQNKMYIVGEQNEIDTCNTAVSRFEENGLQFEICDKFIHAFDLEKRKIHQMENNENVNCSLGEHKLYKAHAQCEYNSRNNPQNFDSEQSKRLHKMNVYQADICHETLSQPTNSQVHKSEKQYKCNICKEDYALLCDLQTHKRIHEGKKPCRCDICHKTFDSHFGLKVHQRIHAGAGPCRCDICHKTCSSPFGLKIHQKIHTRAHRCRCDVCHKTCSNPFGLKIHQKTHAKAHPCRCDICHKTCSSPFGLKIHQRIHVGAGPCRCDICHKTYSSPIGLKIHQSTHKKEKLYTYV